MPSTTFELNHPTLNIIRNQSQVIALPIVRFSKPRNNIGIDK